MADKGRSVDTPLLARTSLKSKPGDLEADGHPALPPLTAPLLARAPSKLPGHSAPVTGYIAAAGAGACLRCRESRVTTSGAPCPHCEPVPVAGSAGEQPAGSPPPWQPVLPPQGALPGAGPAAHLPLLSTGVGWAAPFTWPPPGGGFQGLGPLGVSPQAGGGAVACVPGSRGGAPPAPLFGGGRGGPESGLLWTGPGEGAGGGGGGGGPPVGPGGGGGVAEGPFGPGGPPTPWPPGGGAGRPSAGRAPPPDPAPGGLSGTLPAYQ